MQHIPHNLYIHVPFCVKKCPYCAFYSHACAAPDWDKYRDGIIRDIDSWAEKFIGERVKIPTIFFGGGTPSLMSVPIFQEIINHIRERFDVAADCEITLESNPKTLDADKLRAFRDAGVNRLSVGVQSLNDADLKFLGRIHSAADAIDLIGTASGLNMRVSADFMYGLPEQTADDIIEMCNQINNLPIEHCSMYELTVEDSTPFGKMNLQMPNNETMAEMYTAITKHLKFPRYEVSNYGTPCRHNQNIWDGQPYLGLGDGACGRAFIGGVWFEDNQPISDRSRTYEKIITGMRQMRGMLLTDDVRDAINWDFVNNNSALFKQTESRLAVSETGLLILDNILIKLTK